MMNLLHKYDFLYKLGKYQDYAPIGLRIVIGLIFIAAGYKKLMDISGTAGFFDNIGIPVPLFFAWLVAFVELVGGIAVLFGIGTRYFALLLSIIMVVAILTTKINSQIALAQMFDRSRLDLMLLASNISLMISGGGKYSLDSILCTKNKFNSDKKTSKISSSYNI